MPGADLVRVKLTASLSGDRYSLVSGDVIECCPEEAERLIAAGFAIKAPAGATVTATRGPTFAEVPPEGVASNAERPKSEIEPPSAEDPARAPSEPAAGAHSDSGKGKRGKGKGAGSAESGSAE